MSELSRTEKIVAFLEQNKGKKFTTAEIVEHLLSSYPEDFIEKRAKKGNDKAFLQQLKAECGYAHLDKYHHLIKREKDPIKKKDLLWYEDDANEAREVSNNIKDSAKEKTQKPHTGSEYELYPLLIKYLNNAFNLLCLRIDEKTSSNINGKNGNQWLHPDVVAMKAIDQHWDNSVKDCMKQSSSQNVELWSFEVKIKLESSNVRMSFFQAVSNSSWANEGYLVATQIAENVQEELRVLSALHGIGVILLNPNDILQSKIILPAKHRIDIDWQSVNRIVTVNRNFKEYIDYVSIYYKTGHIIKHNWNK